MTPVPGLHLDTVGLLQECAGQHAVDLGRDLLIRAEEDAEQVPRLTIPISSPESSTTGSRRT